MADNIFLKNNCCDFTIMFLIQSAFRTFCPNIYRHCCKSTPETSNESETTQLTSLWQECFTVYHSKVCVFQYFSARLAPHCFKKAQCAKSAPKVSHAKFTQCRTKQIVRQMTHAEQKEGEQERMKEQKRAHVQILSIQTISRSETPSWVPVARRASFAWEPISCVWLAEWRECVLVWMCVYTLACTGGCSSERSVVVLSAMGERNAQIKHSEQDAKQKKKKSKSETERLREQRDKQREGWGEVRIQDNRQENRRNDWPSTEQVVKLSLDDSEKW